MCTLNYKGQNIQITLQTVVETGPQTGQLSRH